MPGASFCTRHDKKPRLIRGPYQTCRNVAYLPVSIGVVVGQYRIMLLFASLTGQSGAVSGLAFLPQIFRLIPGFDDWASTEVVAQASHRALSFAINIKCLYPLH